MNKKYIVTLTDEERRSLRALVSFGKGAAVPGPANRQCGPTQRGDRRLGSRPKRSESQGEMAIQDG